MPRERIYESSAERQRAYRKRLKERATSLSPDPAKAVSDATSLSAPPDAKREEPTLSPGPPSPPSEARGEPATLDDASEEPGTLEQRLRDIARRRHAERPEPPAPDDEIPPDPEWLIEPEPPPRPRVWSEQFRALVEVDADGRPIPP